MWLEFHFRVFELGNGCVEWNNDIQIGLRRGLPKIFTKGVEVVVDSDMCENTIHSIPTDANISIFLECVFVIPLDLQTLVKCADSIF